MGRPSKLTRKTHKDIEDAIYTGATYRLAAQYAGISYDTLNAWRKRGEAEAARLAADPSAKPVKSEAMYLKFSEMLEDARANAGISWLQVIEQTARTDASWAKYLLQTHFPDDYAPKPAEVTVKGDANAPIQIRTITAVIPREVLPDES